MHKFNSELQLIVIITLGFSLKDRRLAWFIFLGACSPSQIICDDDAWGLRNA